MGSIQIHIKSLIATQPTEGCYTTADDITSWLAEFDIFVMRRVKDLTY